MPDIDWTKPVRWINNKKPLRVLFDHARGTYPVICVDSDNAVCEFTRDGRYFTERDIVVENIPERVPLGWVCMNSESLFTNTHVNRASAEVHGLHFSAHSIAEIYRAEDGKLCIEEHEVGK